MSKLWSAIGLMSGTSLDGIDVAHIRTDGRDRVHRGTARTYEYSDSQRETLRQALRDAAAIGRRDQRPGLLTEAERALTEWHNDAIGRFLQETGTVASAIDVIGFHGQTVLHRPDRRLTVQLGDGPLLSRLTQRPVVFDMRAADVAAGGQGAPLAPAYHLALAAGIPERPVAFVNIGGVANLTWIGPDGELLAFDTGPGNALIDDWMLKRTGVARDENGRIASRGRPSEAVLAQYLGDGFFEEAPPKSLDRNSFGALDLQRLATEDGAATLVEFTARSIALSRAWLPAYPEHWIVCGGGRRNAAIMARLRALLGNVSACEDFGFDGDAMEAEAWAYLAVRSVEGLPLSHPGATGIAHALTGAFWRVPDRADHVAGACPVGAPPACSNIGHTL